MKTLALFAKNFLACWMLAVILAGVHDDFTEATRRSWARPRPSPSPSPSPTVSRADAESILEQVDALGLWDDLDPLTTPAVTELGNLVTPGSPQFVVVFCKSTREATVTDLTPEHAAPAGAELAAAIGSRCYATVTANWQRKLPAGTDCFSVLCFDNDALYKRLHPEGEEAQNEGAK